ncbi:MAG: hypothetical protein WBP34_17890 [Thermoanaerobaculia bacterium]
MNPRGSVLVVSITLFAFVLVSFAAVPAHAQGKSVVITAKCPSDERGPLNFHMNPWEVEVLQGEPLDWILNTNSEDTKIVIEAKEGGEWPYSERRHEGNGRTGATQMKPDAAGVYEYNITIYCGEDRIVIDPRVRVGGGSG